MINTSDWNTLLKEEFSKPYFKSLKVRVDREYKNYTIYPDKSDIYKAFELCNYQNTKVVILGQDPYHQPKQANGLSFAVSEDCKIPKSLHNIYKELRDDLNIDIPTHGNLEYWASQGVLLLNTSLTVREGQAGSHQDIGWTKFTDHVISLLNNKEQPVVFILWGKYAQKKEKLITNPNHLLIKSPHPSPLSAYRGFFKSKPFSKTNNFLIKHGLNPINWQIK